MYIEPRFNPHEYYYGTYLMVDGEYVSWGYRGSRIMKLFGWEPNFNRLKSEPDQSEQFTDWLWYTYPIGLFITHRST